MEVLIINDHDYSQYVERKGMAWSRNDLDSEKTTRTKDGKMRRDKISTKRKMTFTMINMTQEQLAQLDDDLSEATFPATYLDLHGITTKTFYCSSFSAVLAECRGENAEWEGATFSVTEV